MKKFYLIKTVLAVLLVGLMCIGGIPVHVYADDTPPESNPLEDKSSTKIHKPEFQLKRNSQLGSFQAGKNSDLSLPIRNISNHSAYNIKLELVPKKEDEKIFSSREFVIRNVTIRPGNEYTFELPFTINEAAAQAVYDMDIKLTFSNVHKDVFEQVIPVSMYVENKKLAPAISVLSTKIEREFVDSKTPQTLTVEVKNVGQLRARNISMSLEGFDQKTLYLVDDVNIRKISDLAPGMTQTLSFNVITREDTKDNVELSAVFKYVDLMEKPQERTDKFLVPCVEKKENNNDIYGSKIQMKFSAAEYTIHGEGETTANLTIKNNTEKELKNLKLSLAAENGVRIMSKYVDLIDVIKVGETKSFSYKLKSADANNEGSFPITATLVFDETDSSPKTDKPEVKEPKSLIQVAGVTCYKKPNKEDEEKGGKKPKIIIADYKYTGEKILAGKPFDLNIVIKNTSAAIGVKNVKITFSSETEVFIPIDAANSFYIEEIAPGASVNKTIHLTSKPDAEAKMYKMTFVGEYEDQNGKSYDEKGNPFKSEESIALNLNQQIRLEIPDVKVPDMGYVGQGVNIDAEFYNMGKAKLYNLIVKLEGEGFSSETTNYFVGNFEASKSDTFSTSIIPESSGELKGKLIFSFEDERGNKEELVKDFSLMVSDESPEIKDEMGGMTGPDGKNMEFDENGNPIEPSENSEFPWVIVGIVAGIILIVAAVIFVKKRKKKKLEKILSENEENENK